MNTLWICHCVDLQLACIIWATSWENLFLPYANNKDTDQTFVVRCLDSMISLVSIQAISWLLLTSLTEQTGMSHAWSKTLKTRFLVTMLIWWTDWCPNCKTQWSESSLISCTILLVFCEQVNLLWVYIQLSLATSFWASLLWSMYINTTVICFPSGGL